MQIEGAMVKARLFGVVLVLAMAAGLAHAQSDEAQKNAAQARAALDAMVKALGGDAWLNMKNQMLKGSIAAFFQGRPDPGTTLAYEFHAWPDMDRIELTKHRDVVEFFVGRKGWEVTFRGKKAMDAEILNDYLRRRDHSVETVVKVWLKDPNTILVYEGQHLAERHLAEQVTLISAENESVTLLLDTQTHLPLERIFQWRDPVYHDKNTDVEDYAGYRTIDGIATPFTISRTKNGEQVRQFYVTDVKYNDNLSSDFWDPDKASAHIAKQ
jgi:hypothetical protein